MKTWRTAVEQIPMSNLTRIKNRVVEAAQAGRTLGDEDELEPEEGFEYWAREIAVRILTDKDALIMVTGPTGEGKSSLAMRLALRVSVLLREGWDAKSRSLIAAGQFAKTPWSVNGGLAYTVEDLLKFYRSATEAQEKGRIAVFDEGAQALFSGDNSAPEVKTLVKAFNLVRLSGCVLFICVPDLMSIVKSMRVRLAHVWFAVRHRGLARCMVRDRRLKFKPEATFGFSTSSRAPFLLWDQFEPNGQLWKDYSARKQANLLDYLVEAEAANRKPKSGAERTRAWRERKKTDEDLNS